ncbi:MAG: heavy-metal-associated domain-containing protein [Candidatus Izemoplasmatales bacterium]|jgi:copper chaperone CopZ|nr:heavy-metal-associated domain-containing protein [Candidatus Izemoplasmatales bacterium]MDD3865823.1 heavy-metal-associated domain-containing protein [Candidatus Izemoplasmatales bacterium]
MKKAIIEGMCCEGCAKDVKAILTKIYGITNVVVDLAKGYALYDGYVATQVIATALAEEGYRLVDIQKA